MNWTQRLEQLPLRFHSAFAQDLFDLKPGECLEDKRRGATYIATRTFIPTQGIIYAFSIGGSIKGRNELIQELSRELESPLATDHTFPSGLWMYFWKAASQEIPKTDVHRRLGEKRIAEICQQHGLDEEDRKIVDVYLATLRATMGIKWETRMSTIAHALQGLPSNKITRINAAVLQITQEFAAKRHSKVN